MEKIVKKNNPLTGLMAALLPVVGGALLAWSLSVLPTYPAYGFPWEFAGAVLSFVPIAAGGWCLNAIVRRRRDATYRYGQDGTDGTMQLAIFAIIAGVLLLCFNFGALPAVWKRVFFSWQMLLLTIGAGEIARTRFFLGGIVFAVGAFFIGRPLSQIYPDIAAHGGGMAYWPTLLILLGMMILAGIALPRGKCCSSRCRNAHPDNAGRPGSPRASGVLDIGVVFGGSEQVYLDPVFRGGKISTVFGGVELDLRSTELPEGETYLRIESVFGGVEIYAPEGWLIEIRNESVFGGFADKRPHGGGKTYDDSRRLVIHASNVFGGGEIK